MHIETLDMCNSYWHPLFVVDIRNCSKLVQWACAVDIWALPPVAPLTIPRSLPNCLFSHICVPTFSSIFPWCSYHIVMTCPLKPTTQSSWCAAQRCQGMTKVEPWQSGPMTVPLGIRWRMDVSMEKSFSWMVEVSVLPCFLTLFDYQRVFGSIGSSTQQGKQWSFNLKDTAASYKTG